MRGDADVKRAFLVLGGESTGTRLVTRLLLEAGCYGDGDHEQRLDNGFPSDSQMIVWRRSVPHRGKMPDLQVMVEQMRSSGYTVTAVIIVRDWFYTALSQVRAPHVENVATATEQLQDAYRYIFTELPDDVQYVMTTYASLVQQPKEAVRRLYSLLDIAAEPTLFIYDGNAKYV